MPRGSIKKPRLKCGEREYEVWKSTKKGLKFNQCIGNGKNWRSAWNYNKRAGQFISGKYVVVDRKGKKHYVEH